MIDIINIIIIIKHDNKQIPDVPVMTQYGKRSIPKPSNHAM